MPLTNSIKVLIIAIINITMLSPVFASDNLVSKWQKSPYSEAKLHILSVQDKAIELAIEINLEDKYKTYWHTPGTNGVPAHIKITGINMAENSEILKYPFPESLYK